MCDKIKTEECNFNKVAVKKAKNLKFNKKNKENIMSYSISTKIL